MKLEKISQSGLGNGTWTLISVIFSRDQAFSEDLECREFRMGFSTAWSRA